MATAGSDSQWEFDAPMFFEFAKLHDAPDQADSWFAARSERLSHHFVPQFISTAGSTGKMVSSKSVKDKEAPSRTDKGRHLVSAARHRDTPQRKRVDIFAALASAQTASSAAKRTADKPATATAPPPLSAASLPPPPPPPPLSPPSEASNPPPVDDPLPQTEQQQQQQSSSVPSTDQSSRNMPLPAPSLPARVKVSDRSTQQHTRLPRPSSNLKSKDNDKSVWNKAQIKDKENVTKRQQKPTSATDDENVAPPSDSAAAVPADSALPSLATTDFSAIFSRMEELRNHIVQLTSPSTPTDTRNHEHKDASVDGSSAETGQTMDNTTAPAATATELPPKAIPRSVSDVASIDARIQRARRIIRESLEQSKRWFTPSGSIPLTRQSVVRSSSSDINITRAAPPSLARAASSALPSAKWRHNTTDNVSFRRQQYSNDDPVPLGRPTTGNADTRTTRGTKRAPPAYLRAEPTVPKSPKFATDTRPKR